MIKPPTRPAAGGETVLVAEDEESVRRMSCEARNAAADNCVLNYVFAYQALHY